MNVRITSFLPIIFDDSEILILGSIPGVKSLQKQEYYGHPQNAFWKILFTLFKEDFNPDYEIKLDLIKRKKIALWDVIESCERVGSLDTTIKNEISNSVLDLVKQYPNLKMIFCNGQKSHKTLLKQVGGNFAIPIFVLPSTSPLHTISFEEKMKYWSVILNL